MENDEYIVRVASDGSADVPEILDALLEELLRHDGIEYVEWRKFYMEQRDLSEVESIISNLDEERIEALQRAIDSYTEDEE